MSIALAALALITATPATLPATLKRLEPGDTLVLKGEFERIVLPKRVFSPPIIIDARAARVAGVTMVDVSGVTWRGGSITAKFGPDVVAMPSYGFGLLRAANIRIEGSKISDANRGIAVIKSNDIVMSGIEIVDIAVDGIDVASSHNVTLERSKIGPFKPPFQTSNGTGLIHADGFQAWNGCTGLRIVDNVFEGRMHGITDFGNPKLSKWNVGTVIERNHMKIVNTHGISVMMTNGAIIRNNIIESGVSPGRKTRTALRILADTIACGNKVADMPNTKGTSRC
jgi:hypothetical protein